ETLSITRIVAEPGWHYQPAILADVPDDEAEAHLPPGPNNPIGSVWIELSRPHYGIHGTDEPAAIGSASSAGCVRLTNWDARLLADVIEAGMQVRFRDVARQDTAPADTAQADTTQEV